MNEKFFRGIDLSILSILFLTLISSLIYPPYRDLYIGIIYVFLLCFAVFLYILRNKFSKDIVYNETPVDSLLFVIFCWYILSTIFAVNKVNSLNATATFSVLLAFYYLINFYAKTFTKNILWLLLIISLILSLFGFYQYFYGFNHALNYLIKNPVDNTADIITRLKSNRIFSTFIYPNAFAGFLIMVIPVFIGLLKNEKKYRFFIFPCLLLIIIALILTKSIGAFISLITAIILVFFLISDRSIKNFKIFILYFMLIFAGVLIFVIRDRGTHDLISNFSGKYSSIIKMLDISSRYLLSGAGPGNFEEVYNIYRNNQPGYLKYAHNIIMQTVIELGIPGIILLSVLVFTQYKIILENFFFLKTTQSKILVSSLMIATTAFLIHNLVDFDIYNFELALVFILLVAILNSQIIIGTIEIKKIKLIYYLGLNPGKRRSIIYYIIMIVLGLAAFNGAKNIYILSLINVLVAVGFAIWSVSKEEIRQTDLDIPVIFFIIISCLSVFYSPDIYKFTQYLTLILTTITLFYLYSQFLRRYVYKIIISNYLIITGIIISLFIFVSTLFAFFNLRLSEGIFKPDTKILSLYLIIPFCFLLNRILLEKKTNYQNLKISGVFILIAGEFFTGSKSGLLLQFVLLIIIWYYYNKNKLSVKDIYQKEQLKSNLLKLLLAVFLLLTTVSFTKNNNINFSEKTGLLSASLKMLLNKPLTGYGIGSYKSIFPNFNFPSGNTGRYQNIYELSSNEFLQIGTALGVPGIILLLIIIFFIIKNLPETGGHRKVWSASVGAYFSIYGLILSCFFFNTFHQPGLIFTFAILAAMLSIEKKSIPTIPKESLFFIKIYYFVQLIFAFLIFSFLIRAPIGNFLFEQYKKNGNIKYLGYSITVDPLNAKYYFEKGAIFENNGLYEQALKNYIMASKLDKKNYQYYHASGKILIILGDYSSAIKYFEISIKYNPYNIFAYYELSNLYFQKLNDSQNAKKYIIKALEYEPYFVPAKNLFALILKQEGDKIQALNQYNEIEKILNEQTPQTEYEKSLLDFPVEILYLNKALILKDTGNTKEAIKYFEKYYEITADKEIKKIIKNLYKKGSIN